jgi:hypothetical protein
MSAARCWPWSHAWAKWERKVEVWESIPGPLFKDRTPAKFQREFQERRCDVCGLYQRREIT